jgi:hypothetical protein
MRYFPAIPMHPVRFPAQNGFFRGYFSNYLNVAQKSVNSTLVVKFSVDMDDYLDIRVGVVVTVMCPGLIAASFNWETARHAMLAGLDSSF